MRFGIETAHRGAIGGAALCVLFLIGGGACSPLAPASEPGEGTVLGPGMGTDRTTPAAPFGALHDGERSSRAAPRGAPRSLEDRGLTVAVVSDLNGSYGSTEYSEHVHAAVDWITGRLQPDLVLSTGDHVAGQREGLDYGAMWRAFHADVTDPIRRSGIPFAPTPGNHDAAVGEAYEPERRRYVGEWRQRRPAVEFDGEGRYPLYYAFERGPALFVSLDITAPGPLSDQQMEWLRSVLERHDGKPAKIVFAHLPLVPFAEGRQTEIVGDRQLEELFREKGVDVMLSGHHHAYYPGRRGDLKLVGMSCLGGGPRELIGSDRESRQSAAVLRIAPDGEVRVRARYGPEMRQRVRRSALPRSIRHGGWTVWRLGVSRGLAERRR